MALMLLAKRSAGWLFVAIAASIYTVVYLISRTPRAMTHPYLVSAASVFDLTITVSTVFYFLLVRRGYFSRLTLTTVALVGLRAAGLLLPSADQQYLPTSRLTSILLELLLVANVIRRFKHVQHDGDALTRIRIAASAVIPYEQLVNVVAAEIAVFYYALFSWRLQPETSRDSQTFSYAEASGYRMFGTLLVLLILCEGVPLHFLILHFNPVAAWIWTALDTYGLLWALAIIRAARLRTISVDEHSVHIRISLLWEIKFPKEDIASYQRVSALAVPSGAASYLRVVVLNDPQYVVELRRPTVAYGWYRQRRMVTKIGITVDQGEAFASALRLVP